MPSVDLMKWLLCVLFWVRIKSDFVRFVRMNFGAMVMSLVSL